MDQKISQLPVASAVAATDIIPIVSSGTNQKLTVGVLSLNLPNFGNSGITKNVPVAPSNTAIPLLGTTVGLSTAASYTLAAGSNGQEITIFNKINSPSTVNYGGSTVTIGAKGSVTLTFLETAWYIKSSHNCTFA